MMKFQHLILDRDGVLNEESPGAGYVRNVAEFRWIPGALDGLSRLHAAGVRVSVVTNQSGIGRGCMNSSDLDEIHERMADEVCRAGGALDAIFYCPHEPDAHCTCRKPAPGMIEDAIRVSGIDPARTLVVGDARRDLEAAWRCGVAGALVRTGKGRATEIENRNLAIPTYDDLSALVSAIATEPLERRPGTAGFAGIFSEHIEVVSKAARSLPAILERVVAATEHCLDRGGKLLACGNGGSAADAQHLVAELVGRFKDERRAFAAIALTADTATITAVGNDYGFDRVFSRQVEALARPGDLLFAISTSGNSGNVLRAAEAARKIGCTIVALTGAGGGELAAMADLTVRAPSTVVARIQEVHGICVHAIAAAVDEYARQPERVVRASDSANVAADLLPILERFSEQRVWVIGDLMLDEYVTGAVNRISPEAPVPIVSVHDMQSRLGGAANVARQTAVLGAGVLLAGTVGNDEAARQLLQMCDACSIDTSAVVRQNERCTTRKLRVLGQHQQLIRLDWEDSRPNPATASQLILARLEHAPAPDVIILSDYAKGVLTDELLQAVMDRYSGRCPIIVDPKHRDFRRYRGASVITPNLRELEIAAARPLDGGDRNAIADAARSLAQTCAVESLVVTLAERGMLVVHRDDGEVAISAVQREVYDVTGAGDTAIAVLSLALAARGSLVSAARLANLAAGISVGQIGAAAVNREEIRSALTETPAGKILTRTELASKAASWRLAGKRIVFTNGCFDILHSGHLSLLNQAATFGDILVLAINSDASVRRLKGPERPLVSEQDRAALLAALSCVDAVTIFDEDTPLEALQQAQPHVLVKGQDYTLAGVVGREFVESIGGRVELVGLVPEKSTTALVERIRGTRNAV